MGAGADSARGAAQADAQNARTEADVAQRKVAKEAKLVKKREQKRREGEERAAAQMEAAAAAAATVVAAAERAAAEALPVAEERAMVERAAVEQAAARREAEKQHIAEAMAQSMASLQADEEWHRDAASSTTLSAAPPPASPSSPRPGGGGTGRSGRGGCGGRGGRGVNSSEAPSSAAPVVSQPASGVGRHAEVAAVSVPPVLTLADVGDITGRGAVPESTIGGETHLHRLYGSSEAAPRCTVRPSVRVWHLRGADAALPLLSRASADVGGAPHSV